MTASPRASPACREIVVACPRPDAGRVCAALEAGATRVCALGGAQAIAALAYGTASIARVDKIVGPGNAWVAAAKALVAADCAIDLHAGPSEIVVCSDRGRAGLDRRRSRSRRPSTIRRRARFSSRRGRALADAVRDAVRRGRCRPEARRARRSHGNGAIIVAANARGRPSTSSTGSRPSISSCDRAADVAGVHAAGTVFVGRWSAQAAGDYCTGSNHVLPTGGAARFRGGLSAADFVRVFTRADADARGHPAHRPAAVMALAEAEGLTAHARFDPAEDAEL